MAAVLLVFPELLYAQVSQYAFGQSVVSYTEITEADGGYVLGVPVFSPPASTLTCYADPDEPGGTTTTAGYLAPVRGPGYPIGFDFIYNGEVFDRIGISTAGWISFGKSTDGNTAVWIFTSSHWAGRPLSHSYNSPEPVYQRNRIAGMGFANLRPQDQSPVGGPTSEFRVATIGAAPNQVCVIQWRDFRYNYDYDQGLINFQIRLNQVDNSVDVRFGEMNWPQTVGGNYQIGLGGRVSEDFNNRQTVSEEPAFIHDWNNTAAGTVNTSSCILSQDDPFNSPGTATPPVNGMNWKWSPPACPLPSWPLDVRNIRFDRATISWGDPPGVGSFDYVIATVDDPADPNAVVEGNTEDISILVAGLQPLTDYFVFVRSNCNGIPGSWSSATRFRTNGGAVLQCDGSILSEDYCYVQDDRVVWHYSTSDAVSRVRLQMLAGAIGVGNSLKVFYASDTLGTPVWDSASGVGIPGQVFTSTGPYLTLLLSAPAPGSCDLHDWLVPLEWNVGCLDCESPLALYSVVNEDCEALEYDVQVMVVNMGSSSELIITNSQAVAATSISTVGLHLVGPFTAGSGVVVTLENPDNALCNVQSVSLINAPCAIEGCGPAEYSRCYGDHEMTQVMYASGGTEEVGIRFRRGSTVWGDDVAILNGVEPDAAPLIFQSSGGDLANVMRASTGPNTDRSLILSLLSDGSGSCTTGEALAWDYVVACYDGCTQPQASFAVVHDCDNNGFNILVDITDIGSAGAVVITNDGGAPAVNATVAGTYSVGPFPSQEVVNIEVEGASVLCSWTSPALTFDCTTVGIREHVLGQLVLFPNPTDGWVRIRIPHGMQDDAMLVLHDVSGREVASTRVLATSGTEQVFDWSGLPNGVYSVAIVSEDVKHIARINIAR